MKNESPIARAMTGHHDGMTVTDRVFAERNAPRVLCDSDRNIMAGLAHEACDTHCEDCGTCSPRQTNLNVWEDVPMVDDEATGLRLCEDCNPLEGASL